MSRNASGTYSLPAGNPVVTNSVISSTWANTTLADISSALSDSLSRSGLGAMTAGLKLDDGTIGLPGLTFATETTAGLRRASAGNFRFTIGGVDILFLSATAQAVVGTNSAAAGIRFFQANTNAAADNRYWGSRIDQNGDMHLGIYLDADFPAGIEIFKWLQVNRTGSLVDSIAFSANTSISFGGAALSSSGTVTLSHTPTSSIAGNLLLSDANNPILGFLSSASPSDERVWDIAALSTGQLAFRTGNNSGAGNVNWLTVDRTGTTVDRVHFPTQPGTAPFYVGTVGGSTACLGKFRSTAAGVNALQVGQGNGTAGNGALAVHHENTSGDNSFIEFLTEGGNGTVRGSITFNRGGTLTAYNVTSDGRLKKNIRNSADAGVLIDQIKVRAFEWKEGTSSLPHWLVAQELAPLVPYAVTIPSDPEGNWSIDPSKLVPLLVKAVQELRMRVAAGGL